MHRRVPAWWKEACMRGTKQLYQSEKPVVYIVPITSILGRLPLIPLFPLGKGDEDGWPGTGSRLYYISSWAMCLGQLTTPRSQ